MDIKETLAGHHRTVIETKEEDISWKPQEHRRSVTGQTKKNSWSPKKLEKQLDTKTASDDQYGRKKLYLDTKMNNLNIKTTSADH